MQSTFYPVANNQHAIKVSASIQNGADKFTHKLTTEMNLKLHHSYFEGEADQNFNLEKTVMENEIWTQLRINPKAFLLEILKLFKFKYIRLKHKPLKLMRFRGNFRRKYKLSIEELNKTLTINFENNFPFTITSWEETITD